MIKLPKKSIVNDGSNQSVSFDLSTENKAKNKRNNSPLSLIKTTCFLALALVVFSFFISQTKIRESFVIQNPTIKQTSAIVAGGAPIKWSALIKREEITGSSYLLRLPQSASQVTIEGVDTQQVFALLATTTPPAPLDQRVALATERAQTAVAKSNFSVANLIRSIAGRLTNELKAPIAAAVIVDLSDQLEIKATIEEGDQTRADGNSVINSLALLSKISVVARVISDSVTLVQNARAAETDVFIPTEVQGTTVTTDTDLPAEAGWTQATSEAPVEPSTAIPVDDFVPPVVPVITVTDLSTLLSDTENEKLAEIPTVIAPEVSTSTVSEISTADVINSDSTEVATTTATSSIATSTDVVTADELLSATSTSGLDPESASSSEFIKVDFETPAPVISEQLTDHGKLVTISSLDENPATPLVDVLASTKIPKLFKVGEEDKINIKWKNNGDQDMSFQAYDTNSDGYLDYVEWTVPHLSEQVFEIIYISKAFLLDADQNIVADIYSETQNLDGHYATVADGQFVRVTFNRPLDDSRDITVYARPLTVSSTFAIEVYPVYTDADGNQTQGPKIALVEDGSNPDFSNIDHEGKYRILLNNLSPLIGGATAVFDLHVISVEAGSQASLQIDYIVDPSPATYYWTGNTGAYTNVATNWTTDVGGACGVSTGGNVPTAGDTAVFSSGCTNNAFISNTWSLAALTLGAGYSGTVTASTTGIASTTISGDLTVASGTLAIGTNDLAITGNSTVTGTLTIGASTGNGWTTTNLTIGAGGTASSTAPGTIYYNQVTVSGTLSPDTTGVYTVAGMYGGKPYYAKVVSGTTWYLSNFDYAGVRYLLTTSLGAYTNPSWRLNSSSDGTPAAALYSSNGIATGNATVANVTASGEYTRLNISKITIAGNYDQSNTSSKFLAASSLFTVNSNGTFTADGTVNSTQYNGASLVLNGANTLTYNNNSAGHIYGFNNLIAGQGGSTTTLASNLAIRELLTIGSGVLTSVFNSIYLVGANPLSFNVASKLSVSNIILFGPSAQNIPPLSNGYDCRIIASNSNTVVNQLGDIILNSDKDLRINGEGFATRGPVVWNTNGYNITVGGNLTIGAGTDTGLKKLDATSPTSTRNSIITVGGNWLNYGNGTASSTFISASSTVIFNSTTTGKTITSGSSTSAFYNVNFTGVGAAYTFQDNFSVLGDLNVVAGTINVGTNNLAVTGNTTISNATTTIGVSSSNGWTTNNLTIGAGGAASSTAPGTIYYNQVTVSGNGGPVSPNGTYTAIGIYNGKPIYQRGSDSQYLRISVPGTQWLIVNALPPPDGTATIVWGRGENIADWTGTYNTGVGATGNATVANVTASGEYTRLNVSKITIAGNYDQSATSSKFLAGSSLITVNGNGTFTADGTINQAQYNGASLVLNGVNTLNYGHLSAPHANGFNNLISGQGGVTTTLVSTFTVKSVITIGSGTLYFGGYQLFVAGVNPLSFDVNSHLSCATGNLSFINYTSINQTIPSLINGYDCNIVVQYLDLNKSVIQTGNIVINGTKYLAVTGWASISNPASWKTDGYNLTVGGNLVIGQGGGDTSLKKIDATSGSTSTRSSTITIGGNWLNYGNGSAPSQFIAASSSVIMNGNSSSATITSGASNSPFYNLTLNSANGTYTLQDGLVVAHNLTLTAGTLDSKSGSNYSVTIGSASPVNGDFSQTTSSRFIARNSTITLNGNGNFTADGTLDSGQFNNATTTLNGTNTLTYNNLSAVYANGFYNLVTGQYGNITTLPSGIAIRNILTIGSGTLTGATGYINFPLSLNPLSFNASSSLSINSINFYEDGNVNIPTLTNGFDCNISLSGNGGIPIVTQTGDVVINTGHFLNLTYTTAKISTWKTNGYNLTVGGNLQIGLGSDSGRKTLDATSGSTSTRNSIITIGGNWLNYGKGSASSTFIAASSTVIFNSTSTGRTITTGSSSAPFNAVQFNGVGGAWTLLDNFVATSTTLTQGTLIDNGKTVTVNGNISISGSAGSVLTSSGTWIQGASGNIANSAVANSFYSLTMAGSGVTSTMTDIVRVGKSAGSTLTLGPGALAGNYQLAISPFSNDAININNVTVVSPINELYINVSADVTQKAITLPNNFAGKIRIINTLYNITATGDWNFNNNAFAIYTVTTAPTKYLDMGFSTLTAGAVSLGNAGAYNGYLKLGTSVAHSIASLAMVTNAGNSNKLDFGTSATAISGNINFTGITVTPGSSTVNLNGTSTQTITSNGQSFYNLTHSGSGTMTLADNLVITGAFNHTAGTLNPAGWNINTTGNFTIADGAQVTASGLNSSVYYNQVQVTGTLTPDATGVYTYGGMYTKSGTARPYYTNGTYYLWWYGDAWRAWLISSPLGNTGLNWQHVAESVIGSMTPANGAVGTPTVANVTASGFIGSTVTVGGNFNVAGHAGSLLALNPTSTWYLNVAGTANANYVNVAYSDASGGSTVVQSNSTDSGHNVNWAFDYIGPSVATTTISGFTTFANYIKGTGTVLGGYATDTASGVDTDTCEYTLNGGVNWFTAIWNINHCEKSAVSVNDSEYYTFNTQIKDIVGNQGTGTSTITYTGDTVAPTTTDDATSAWTNTNQIINFVTTDGTGSGVSSTYYCLDTDGTCTPTTLVTSTSITVVGATGTTTEQYVRYYSVDHLGNTESIKTSNLVKIDKTTSVISNLAPAIGSNIAKSGQAVTFTTDKPSTCRFALSAKSYDNMASDYSCSVANSIQMTCTLPNFSYGTQNVYLACEDYLGNKDTVETITSVTYNVPQPPGGFIFWPVTPAPVIILPTTTSSTIAIVTTTPKGVTVITINNGTKVTTKPKVTITLTPTPGTTAVIISTNPDFNNAVTLPFVASPTGQASFEYDLCQGQASCLNKDYTIYTKFLDASGGDSPAFSANINLKLPSMNVPTVSVGDQIKAGISNLVGFFSPQTETPLNFPPLANAVPKETPFAFLHNLILTLPAMNDFVFAALPRDFMNIANKFPQVASALKNIGITRMGDAGQLEVAKVTLPGLAEAAGISGIANLAITDLTKTQSQRVPTNMVFARGGNNNLDLNVNLSISNQGTALQTLNTIQGHPLTLAIKPDQPAATVKGYLIFKSNRVGEAEASSTSQVIPGLTRNLSPRNLTWVPAFAGMTESGSGHANDLMNLIATPASAMEMQAEVNVGNTNTTAPATTNKTKETPDLVLAQFDYKESDNGIWTADVASPLVLGQYELRTVVEYKNKEATPETVSMVVIVDPEGYVFRKLADGSEARITNAVVSIYWLNPETKQYELWPASNFRQENPQTTDVTGRYAFLVPPGDYYLIATAGNYGNYQSEVFKVEENKGVFMNLELIATSSWLGWLNIQNILLGGILLVMLYFAVLFTVKRKRVV